MTLGVRTILWLSDPSLLIRVRAAPWGRRVLSACPCPGLRGRGAEELVGWLAWNVRLGTQVDVIHQRHLLRIENFPALGASALAPAVAGRLKRELLLDPATMVSHLVRLDGPSFTQGVVAGVLASEQLAVTRAIEGSGLAVGRTGFAGQLLVASLARARMPAGKWTTVDDLALSERLVVMVLADGQIAAAHLTGEGEDALGLVRLALPRQTPDPAPFVPADVVQGTARALQGAALPPLPAAVVPAFVRESASRIPSRWDVEYPYFFSLPAWAFALIALMMASYALHLWTVRRDQMASAPRVAELAARKTAGAGKGKSLDQELARLAFVATHVQGVSVELFDNMAWLHFVARIRDRHAPDLIFDTVECRSASLKFAGTGDVAQILALLGQLASWLSESQVDLAEISLAEAGRRSYAFTIKRTRARPPSAWAKEELP